MFPIAVVLMGGSGAAAPQKARPTSDVSNDGWFASTGGAATYATIDETPASDADFNFTESPDARFGVGFPVFLDPSSSTGHTIRYRARAPYTGSALIQLYQSATFIAQWTQALTGSFADYSHTLSGAEADSITDYGALRGYVTALL